MYAEAVVGATLSAPCLLPPVGVGFGNDLSERVTTALGFLLAQRLDLEVDHFYLSSEINGFST